MFTTTEQALQSATLLETPIAIIVAFGLALLIAWLYKKTHHGFSYSQSFVFTLVLLTILAAVTMLVIEGSLARAFTLLGAFSIIRFRTAVKDTKDTVYIFWAMIIGMGVGVGAYALAVTATVLIGTIVVLLTHYRFGSLRNYEHVLTFLTDASSATSDQHRDLFRHYIISSTLLNVTARESGAKLEYTYNVKFRDENEVADFMRELVTSPLIENPSILLARDDIEY